MTDLPQFDSDSEQTPLIDDVRQHLDMARASIAAQHNQLQDATVRLSYRLSQLTLDYFEAVAGEIEYARKALLDRAQ